MDLVIALGTPANRPLDHAQKEWFWWEETRKLGLFLQERRRPEQVYKLAIVPGFSDCAARIERATSTDTVISCEAEKSARQPHRKFIYDIRAKALVHQLSYDPFYIARLFPHESGAVFVACDSKRLTAVEFQPGRESPFRVLNGPEAESWIRRVTVEKGTIGADRQLFLYVKDAAFHPPAFGRSGAFTLRPASRQEGSELIVAEGRGPRERTYPLPQSTYDTFAAARPQRVKDGYVRGGTTIAEHIGPWQIEGGKLWFGKNFYDGEGHSGVGGFGYFDSAQRRFHMFSPPEVAPWSVTAIDVGPSDIWMALVYQAEWSGNSGGLLRFDRASETLQRIPLRDIGTKFLRIGDRILLATQFGVALIDNDNVTRYFIDQMSDGRLRVAMAK